MPSFYNPSRQMPLTPPEYSTGFENTNCSNMAYQYLGYGSHPFAQADEMAYDYNSRYARAQQTEPIQPQPVYSSAMNMTANTRSYDLQLPPVHTLEPMEVDPYQQPPAYQRYDSRPQQQKPKDEKSVGGVSAKLDYDMDCMTDFVAETALSLVPTGGRPAPSGFRKWVHRVMCATRLPSATIMLSLHYLSKRMLELQTEGPIEFSDNHIYRVLTVALMMGSKFLDDNTFINRSWADVSGIDIKTLNHLERDWLCATNWILHVDPSEGFNDWMAHWRVFEQRAVSRGAQSLKLSPLDTNVQRQAISHTTFSPQSAMTSTFTPMSAVEHSARSQFSNYNTPAYAPYDPWLIPRPVTDNSPNSAPHTGPTTPEYYGGPGTWAPLDNGSYSYTRRGQGRSQLPQLQPQLVASQHHIAPYTPYTPAYDQTNSWTGHSLQCNCGACSRQHMHYWSGAQYPQPMIAA